MYFFPYVCTCRKCQRSKKRASNKQKNPLNPQINEEPQIPYSLASVYSISICAKSNAIRGLHIYLPGYGGVDSLFLYLADKAGRP